MNESKGKIKYLDMFADIGGFRSELANVGDFFMPVAWCEIDPFQRLFECWRLQKFTVEEFFKAKADELSDSRLYKMAGNVVTVPVIIALSNFIKQIHKERIGDL